MFLCIWSISVNICTQWLPILMWFLRWKWMEQSLTILTNIQPPPFRTILSSSSRQPNISSSLWTFSPLDCSRIDWHLTTFLRLSKWLNKSIHICCFMFSGCEWETCCIFLVHFLKLFLKLLSEMRSKRKESYHQSCHQSCHASCHTSCHEFYQMEIMSVFNASIDHCDLFLIKNKLHAE